MIFEVTLMEMISIGGSGYAVKTYRIEIDTNIG